MDDSDVLDYAKRQLLAELTSVGSRLDSSSPFVKGEDCMCMFSLKKMNGNDSFSLKIICEDSLREILKILVTDNESRKLFSFFGKLRAVQATLLPLMVYYRDDPEIVFQVVRILAMLTMPVPMNAKDSKEQQECLQLFGRAFIDEPDALAVLMIYLEQPLSFDSNNRTVRANQLLELLLTLLKNLLEIPNANSSSSRLSYLYNLHDEIILKFADENILEAFVLLSQFITDENGSNLNLLLLEIFALLFKLEEPSKLFAGKASSTTISASKSRIELAAKAHRSMTNTSLSTRHSNFGGTLIVNMMGGKSQFANFNNIETLLHTGSTQKVVVKSSKKNTKAAEVVKKSSTLINEPIRKVLYNIACSFVKSGFRELITSVFKDFEVANSKVVASDKLNFMNLCSFFLEFHRLFDKEKNMKEKNISQDGEKSKSLYDASEVFIAVSARAFSWLLRHVKIFLGEEKGKSMWSAIQPAVNMYRNMILTLYEMSNRGDPDNLQTSELLLRTLFYERETIDIVANLLRYYELSSAPKQYLMHMVETVHYALHMLKHFGEKNGNFVMRDRIRKVRAIKKSPVKEVSNETAASNEEASARQNDDEVTPQKTTEGSASVESQSMATQLMDDETTSGENSKLPEKSIEEEEPVITNIEDDEMPRYVQREMEMNFSTLLQQFMHSNVIRCYMLLLEDYRTNSTSVNTMIIKFLERVMNEKLGAFLFHVPYFTIFDEILQDQEIKSNPVFDKLRALSKRVCTDFVERCNKDPMLFILALFKHSKGQIEEMTNPGEKLAQKIARTEAREKRSQEALQKRIQASLSRSANLSLADQIQPSAELYDVDESGNIQLRTNAEYLALQEEMKESDSEEEPDVDTTEWKTISAEFLSKKRRETPAVSARWTKEEEEQLKVRFAEVKDDEDFEAKLQANFPERKLDNIIRKLRSLELVAKGTRLLKSRSKHHSESESAQEDNDGEVEKESKKDRRRRKKKEKKQRKKEKKRLRKEAKRLAKLQAAAEGTTDKETISSDQMNVEEARTTDESNEQNSQLHGEENIQMDDAESDQESSDSSSGDSESEAEDEIKDSLLPKEDSMEVSEHENIVDETPPPVKHSTPAVSKKRKSASPTKDDTAEPVREISHTETVKQTLKDQEISERTEKMKKIAELINRSNIQEAEAPVVPLTKASIPDSQTTSLKGRLKKLARLSKPDTERQVQVSRVSGFSDDELEIL